MSKAMWIVLLGCLFAVPVSPSLAVEIDLCGSLVDGDPAVPGDCPVLRVLELGDFLLTDYGSFVPGDVVHVTGHDGVSCWSNCLLQIAGCIEVETITLCAVENAARTWGVLKALYR